MLEYLGADTFLIVDGGALGQVTVRTHGDTDLKPGQRIGLNAADDRLHFFGSDGLAI